MPSNNPSQRIAVIPKRMEIIRAENLSHPDNSGRDTSGRPWTASGQSGRAICISWGGGTTEVERDSFVEDHRRILLRRYELKVPQE